MKHEKRYLAAGFIPFVIVIEECVTMQLEPNSADRFPSENRVNQTIGSLQDSPNYKLLIIHKHTSAVATSYFLSSGGSQSMSRPRW